MAKNPRRKPLQRQSAARRTKRGIISATLRKKAGPGRPIELPVQRSLQIFAFDPMLGRTAGNRLTITISNERDLAPGPRGRRVEVIDYDSTHKTYYEPVDLDHPSILMQGGLDPTESDPRFHQQMVYAVAMRTVENFDGALGRPVNLSRYDLAKRRRFPRLRLFPHAFHGANAYYDRALHAVLFGYFRADQDNPGPNLPGQTVYACLSHDIIAHEMTHALVDRLRPYFLEPSNQDVLAFHEGFADVVALFQHFSFRDILREQIQATRSDIRTRTPLVEMAQQFGYAIGAGRALRSALDIPDARLYANVTEPHDRGSILVAAVFDGFFTTYQRRIADLLRIATGGTGTLPAGALHPDLVNRVAGEASRVAQQILNMCVRAFDYLPPVDITFGDYLRALVTADYELAPNDEWGERAALIEAFRLRAIYPDNVASLAEESLRWSGVESGLPPLKFSSQALLPRLLLATASFSRDGGGHAAAVTDFEHLETLRRLRDEDTNANIGGDMALQLHRYATDNARRLRLNPALPIRVEGFHPVFRVSPSGELLTELVMQFTQLSRARQAADLGGLPVRGGTTVVASAAGKIRYIIAKPLPGDHLGRADRQAAKARIERQADFVAAVDAADPFGAYLSPQDFKRRMVSRMNLKSLHQGF